MKNSLCLDNYFTGFIKKGSQSKLLYFKKLKKYLFLSLIIGVSSCTESKVPKEWSGITVNVKSDQPIETFQELTDETGGFKRLDIMLSNKSNQTITIDSIEIHIPITKSVAKDMKVSYGSSCMGQRPVSVHKVSEPHKKSYSYMHTMLKMDVDQYVFAGSLSWRIFMPIFTQEDNAFVIRSSGEGKQLKPGETIHYEQIVLSRSSNWQELLDNFGSAIAEENNIKQLKEVNFKGWATWDYYAYKFSAKDIYENIETIKQIDSTANLIQIDAGWYSKRGDFADSRPDLPGGMKEIAERIKTAGMIPGVWIDGFRANTESEVFKNHPEYFLRDENGSIIVREMRPEGADRDRVYLDYTHPGARAHIAECIRAIRENMGITYFKVDFMRYGLNSEILRTSRKVKSIKAYDSTVTDVERMRLGLKTIRDAVGPDNYLLGCSAVFGPCIGFVDGMRTGGDISPRYEAFPERVLANIGNYYLSGKVFNGDADYLVFREADDEDAFVSQEKVKHGGSLTLNEAQMWADFNKLYGNCRLNSDKLKILRPERQALVKGVFEFPAMDETIPLDFWQHGKDREDGYELLLARHNTDIYLGIFNWSDESKQYILTAFDAGTQIVDARHSKILKYKGSLSFKELSKILAAKRT